MPQGVNNLRIGEAILQGGRDTFLEEPWEELDRDAFLLSGDLLEVKVKPSMPIGKSGVDAFGQRPQFVDEGDRLRGIANIGREDVIVEGLEAVHKGVRVLGASSDHLVLDLTDAQPPLKVGDRVGFRMNYGAMLTVMTSEYVEKAPLFEVEEKPAGKTALLVREPGCADAFEVKMFRPLLAAIGYDIGPSPENASVVLTAGPDRRSAWRSLRDATGMKNSLGLIWIDSKATLLPDAHSGDPAEGSVLTRVIATLRPQISPENVVIVGLREANQAEAELIKTLRISVFTIVDIDAQGIREVMREAIRIAAAGTEGYHVSYSPTVTDMPGWTDGSGGMTVRETHQAMEAIALRGGMTSMNVSPMTREQETRVASETVGFILSALGKQIL
jgi:arginase family enzyme